MFKQREEVKQNQLTESFQSITDSVAATWNWIFQKKEQPKLVYHPTFSSSKQWPTETQYRYGDPMEHLQQQQQKQQQEYKFITATRTEWPQETEYRYDSMKQQEVQKQQQEYKLITDTRTQCIFQQPELKEELKTVLKTEQKQVLKQTTTSKLSADTTVIPKEVQIFVQRLEAMPAALKAFNINIPNLRIKSDSGGTYKCGAEGCGFVFEFDPSNNRYKLKSGSSRIRAPRGDPKSNARLYETLIEAVPQILDISPSEFRHELADFVELNPDIGQHFQFAVKQNNLQSATSGSSGADNVNNSGINMTGNGNESIKCNNQANYGYGNDNNDGNDEKRRKSRKRSESIHEDPTEETAALEHLLTRFAAVFDMAAEIQAIAEHLQISRDEVVQEGRSQYQDRHSSNYNCHASHIIRAQLTEKVKNMLDNELFEYLKTKFGCTELVEKWANKWGGIGQDIDILQGKLLKLLEAIDFSQNPPCLVENYPLHQLQNTINEINKLLLKIDPSATGLTLPGQTWWNAIKNLFIVEPAKDSITAESIVDMCIDCCQVIVAKWIKEAGSHFMNSKSIKNVLEQLSILLEHIKSDLLKLGAKEWKKMHKWLIKKEKCKKNGIALHKDDSDDDSEDYEEEVEKKKSNSSNEPKNKGQQVTMWGLIKNVVKKAIEKWMESSLLKKILIGLAVVAVFAILCVGIYFASCAIFTTAPGPAPVPVPAPAPVPLPGPVPVPFPLEQAFQIPNLLIGAK